MPAEKHSKSRELTHDRLADRFDSVMNEYDINRRLDVLIDGFLSSVDLTDQLVLDAGCGTGRATQRLVSYGAQVVSLDLGFHLTQVARSRGLSSAVVGNVLELPFADNTFFVVFSTEVIEHTPNPLMTIEEMYRVLKPGGHLVLSTPGWLWQGPVRLASLLRLRPYDGLENFVKHTTLRLSAEKLGAIVLEHRGLHLLPFQISVLHRFLRFADHFGHILLPVMINQCLHCMKPGRVPDA